MIELIDTQNQEAVIKVIGVGGCGGNAIDHMIAQGVQGVEFISANTDAQALRRNQARVQLQLGAGVTKGLGAGADPELGRQAALEDRERIAELIGGADMLFLTAGMGGGTGTGAAPVVAEVAKELGILTVAVVTKPFAFEGKRQKIALTGIEALSPYVDSLIVVPNDKLMQVLGNQVTLDEAFKAANDVLHGAVAGIAEIISCPGMINADFADVRTVMSEMGMAMMGSAKSSGPDRARMAADQAIACPLLEDINISDARGVLINISASKATFQLQEMYDVMEIVKACAAESATVILGAVYDEGIEDNLRVTLVATGLGKPLSRQQAKPLIVVQKTGTDNAPAEVVDYDALDQPAVIRRRNRDATIEAMRQSGVEMLDIPAFLRKQAD
ncbi:MAG: cell division protein FtsZ [Betaproteobacteria bacterium RIFCSPLOWO2_12_FULL_62_58]|nr:MAG: cell division protein FtsZ [Betaproteobacteria bacterium RIFCSPLOWO2_02_FULL_62_79]OGA49061.1 MAG: cell division protein FtsZ [Betaproteobacteria bacterium RIFCSPLOWO2_12_FULL_62_58]